MRVFLTLCFPFALGLLWVARWVPYCTLSLSVTSAQEPCYAPRVGSLIGGRMIDLTCWEIETLHQVALPLCDVPMRLGYAK